MRTEPETTPARLGLDPRFALVPEPAAPFTRTAETELERLKNRLLRLALEAVTSPALLAFKRPLHREITVQVKPFQRRRAFDRHTIKVADQSF